MFRKVKSNLPKGIMVLMPLAVTFYILWILFNKIDGILGGLIAKTFGFSVPGLGFLLIVLFVFVVGWVRDHFIGEKIIISFESTLEKTPFAGKIFTVVKQVRDAFTTSGKRAFKEVGLIEYPRNNIYSLCFITGESKGEVQQRTCSEILSVFLPTTPNPTSGFLLFVPKKDVLILEMSVEEALKMIISGGMVVPKYKSVAEVNKLGKEIVQTCEE